MDKLDGIPELKSTVDCLIRKTDSQSDANDGMSSVFLWFLIIIQLTLLDASG